MGNVVKNQVVRKEKSSQSPMNKMCEKISGLNFRITFTRFKGYIMSTVFKHVNVISLFKSIPTAEITDFSKLFK